MLRARLALDKSERRGVREIVSPTTLVRFEASPRPRPGQVSRQPACPGRTGRPSGLLRRGENLSMTRLDKDVALLAVLAQVESLQFLVACNPQTHGRIEQLEDHIS